MSANQSASRAVSSLRCGGAVPDRLFTPAEANSALPEVREAAERLVALRARMRTLDREQRDLVTAIGGNGGGYAANDPNAAQSELKGLSEAAAACADRLLDLGVLIKDPDVGLLDFPADRSGETVLLCWRLGEERVEFWHTLTDGFAGRRPIDWGE
jgi:hypothetical protein